MRRRDSGGAKRGLQAIKDGRAFRFIGVVGLLDQPADLVLRRQRDRDQRRGDGDLAPAHAIECGFNVVREGRDGVEAKHRAGPLDRVQGTERRVHQVGIVRTMLQVEQGLLELIQQVRGFLAVGLRGIGVAHVPSTLRTTASNWSCWNGLVIQPVAPAALASCFM